MEGYYKHIRGRWGEDEAAVFLKSRGFKILARNFRTIYGELDIVAEKSDILYFFEIKTRSDSSAGTFESFTSNKRRKFLSAAKSYMFIKKISDTQACRCVLLVVLGSPSSHHLTRFFKYDII